MIPFFTILIISFKLLVNQLRPFGVDAVVGLGAREPVILALGRSEAPAGLVTYVAVVKEVEAIYGE